MITICGSIAFYDDMLEVAAELQRMGMKVALPPAEVTDEAGQTLDVREYYSLRKGKEVPGWVWERKAEAMHGHFKTVAAAEAILVLNYDKKSVAGYVGANTLLEMGLAFYLGKPIYLLKAVPDMAYTEEILGMRPVVLDGELERLPARMQSEAKAGLAP